MTLPIYHSIGSGFGDLWASLSWCMRKSTERQHPIYLSTWSGVADRTDERARLVDMLDALDTTCAPHGVVLSDSKGSTCIGYECWGAAYIPTRVRWSPDGHIPGLIAHQFDGVSSGHLKNPPPDDVGRFRAWAWDRALSVARVGLPLTLAQCIRLLSVSEHFVGVCSGMSMLAISVGVPVTVVEYQVQAPYWYGPNMPTMCPDLPAFMLDHERRLVAHAPGWPVGTWAAESGYQVEIIAGGKARGLFPGHELAGRWRRTAAGAAVRWVNEFVYHLTPTPSGVVHVDEVSPHGTTQSTVARKVT